MRTKIIIITLVSGLTALAIAQQTTPTPGISQNSQSSNQTVPSQNNNMNGANPPKIDNKQTAPPNNFGGGNSNTNLGNGDTNHWNNSNTNSMTDNTNQHRHWWQH